MSRTLSTRMLIALELVFGALAMLTGWLLLGDPTGASLPPLANAVLVGTPFEDYRIPGLVLFVVNGSVPIGVAIAALFRMPWAHWGHLVVGVLTTGWTIAQGVLVGFGTVNQGLFLMLSLLVTVLALVEWNHARRDHAAGTVARVFDL